MLKCGMYDGKNKKRTLAKINTRDSRKYDPFRGKLAVLFINLLVKGLTQEINGDGGSI